MTSGGGSVRDGSRPGPGNHPSRTYSVYSAISPSQNTGNDEPTRATNRDAWSTALFWWRADVIPRAMPPMPPTMSAPNASSAVAGSRSQMSDVTDCLVRNDVPRSPLNRFLTYVTYCSRIPPSRPQRSLAAWTTSSLFMLRSPTIAATGSAGMIRATMKATVMMPSSSSGTIASRRRTYRVIASAAQPEKPSSPSSRLQQAL